MITRAKRGIFKPKVCTSTLESEEPVSYEKAVKCREWRIAMDDEYNALSEK